MGPVMQRARGAVSVALRDGAVAGLRQEGCGKAFVHPGGQVVLLNTAGGLTGGDRFEQSVTVRSGAAVATTQAAERLYASAGGAAEVSVRLDVGPGARLDWLPQETIAFERSALRRTLRAELAPDATLLLTEMLVLGRAAHGETVTRLDLIDRREVRRGGRPIWIEPLAVDEAVLARGTPSLLGGARALATLALIGPGAEDALPILRAPAEGVEAAASAWDGRAVLRMRGGHATPVRRALTRAIIALRGDLPRVWQREDM